SHGASGRSLSNVLSFRYASKSASCTTSSPSNTEPVILEQYRWSFGRRCVIVSRKARWRASSVTEAVAGHGLPVSICSNADACAIRSLLSRCQRDPGTVQKAIRRAIVDFARGAAETARVRCAFMRTTRTSHQCSGGRSSRCSRGHELGSPHGPLGRNADRLVASVSGHGVLL